MPPLDRDFTLLESWTCYGQWLPGDRRGYVSNTLTADGCPDDGPAVRRVLKGVSQAALSKQAGRPGRWWTRGGSDRYKHGHAAVASAVRCVAEQRYVLAAIAMNKVLDVE